VTPAPAHDQAISPALESLLHTWMPRQRWYPAKGRGVGLRDLGTVEGGLVRPAGAGVSDDGTTLLATHLVGLDSGDRVDVVQVPLTYRTDALPHAEHALLGELDMPGLGSRHVYDGTHDPLYVAELLAALEVAPGADPLDRHAPAHVLRGEQSNTSIVVEPEGRPPAIVKVFRTLHPGANPDVEVTAAVSRAGCDRVPAVLGWRQGSWPGADGGHLAVAVEFLAGSQDAWREALVSVEGGFDFSAAARSLGAAVAEVHDRLAEAFGTTPVDAAVRERLVQGLRERVAWARSASRDLDPFADRLDAHVAALGDLVDLPPLQRVHGDLHLGQVLDAPGRGWVLLDFEGEPLRPLAERTAPDLALRDVAGMLRSFDYAARHATLGLHGDAADAAVRAADRWAADAGEAFCAGYGQVRGEDPRAAGPLLQALELDKALYELVYETRNRPSWVGVPLHAVTRLLR
jgi:predicted trehalose synthase